MFVVNSYSLAVIFCFITMLCWGSWGNTQKLAGKTWRYELFYWDYVIGMVLFAILLGFTMGSIGTEGRPFLEDLAQAEWGGIGSVVLGGVIFNASNILLSASVSLAGLSVAFPLSTCCSRERIAFINAPSKLLQMLITSPVAFICVVKVLFALMNLSNGRRGIFTTQ